MLEWRVRYKGNIEWTPWSELSLDGGDCLIKVGDAEFFQIRKSQEEKEIKCPICGSIMESCKDQPECTNLHCPKCCHTIDPLEKRK